MTKRCPVLSCHHVTLLPLQPHVPPHIPEHQDHLAELNSCLEATERAEQRRGQHSGIAEEPPSPVSDTPIPYIWNLPSDPPAHPGQRGGVREEKRKLEVGSDRSWEGKGEGEESG